MSRPWIARFFCAPNKKQFCAFLLVAQYRCHRSALHPCCCRLQAVPIPHELLLQYMWMIPSAQQWLTKMCVRISHRSPHVLIAAFESKQLPEEHNLDASTPSFVMRIRGTKIDRLVPATEQCIAQMPSAYIHCYTRAPFRTSLTVHNEASHNHGDRLMNTPQQAVYTIDQRKLHPIGPIKPSSIDGNNDVTGAGQAMDDAAIGLSPMLSASGKAVLRTHKALVRKTARLYHRVQRDLTAEALSTTLKLRVFEASPRAMAQKVEQRDSETDGLTYVPGWSAKAVLPDGTGFILRPLLEEDRDQLEEGFERLSHESRYQRFMTSMETLPEHYLSSLTNIDRSDEH